MSGKILGDFLKRFKNVWNDFWKILKIVEWCSENNGKSSEMIGISKIGLGLFVNWP